MNQPHSHPEHELVVRLNGTAPAYSGVGRQRSGRPRVCTSVSLFVFRAGRRVQHVLVDCGPGVSEAIQAENLFPEAFPIDWLILSHAHGDHWGSLDTLCGDHRRYRALHGLEPAALRVFCPHDTFHQTIGAHLPYLIGTNLRHEPAEPGRSYILWEDGTARLKVTLLEVGHHRHSVISIFTFTSGARTARVVCLFDFLDFHPSNDPRARKGARADNPLLYTPDLLVAESNTWQDPRQTTGRPTGHVWFERLADHLCRWRPMRTRVVHYAGWEDAFREGPARYTELLAGGERIHPSRGPAADWEFDTAMQHELLKRGYPAPLSVTMGRQSETFVVFPAVQTVPEQLVGVEADAEGKLRITGPLDVRLAHRLGLPHTTALLLPRVPPTAAQAEGKILLHRRSEDRQVCPDTWDTCGGHAAWGGPLLGECNRDDPDLLARVADETALRECNEEIGTLPHHFFTESDLRRLGQPGEFSTGQDHLGSGNHEYSTAYVVLLPPGAAYRVCDTDCEDDAGLPTEAFTLDDLLSRYAQAPQEFADGIGRILQRLTRDREQGEGRLEKVLRDILRLP